MLSLCSKCRFLRVSFFAGLLFIIIPSISTAEDIFLSGENTSPIVITSQLSQPNVTTDKIYADLVQVSPIFVGGDAIDVENESPHIVIEVEEDEKCNVTLDKNASVIVNADDFPSYQPTDKLLYTSNQPDAAIFAHHDNISITLNDNASIININDDSSSGIYVESTNADISLLSGVDISSQTTLVFGPSSNLRPKETASSYGINFSNNMLYYGIHSTTGTENIYSKLSLNLTDATVSSESILDIINQGSENEKNDLLYLNYSCRSIALSKNSEPISGGGLTRGLMPRVQQQINIEDIQHISLDHSLLQSYAKINGNNGFVGAIGYDGNFFYGGRVCDEHYNNCNAVYASANLNFKMENNSKIVSTAVGVGNNLFADATGVSIHDFGYNDYRSLSTNVFTIHFLAKDSSISTTATVTDGSNSSSSATGISAYTKGIMTIDLVGSEITALADAKGDDCRAKSTGINLSGPLADITVNMVNSRIKAVTAGSATNTSYGIFASDHVYSILGYSNADMANVEINIDATSSISGQWSIFGDKGNCENEKSVCYWDGSCECRQCDSNITVNNSGLLDGRLQVTRLNNTSTGRLGATLSGTSSSRIFNNIIADSEPYFVANEAVLANGTIFQLKSPDQLALNNINDTSSYRLLYAQSGAWDINKLVLQSGVESPLLEVSWSDLSDANNLIASAHFLTPQQAGLSPNATRATLAAIDAGVFTFDSSPEDWIPNISGAMVMGAASGLRHSTGSVHTRINSMRGINSGDELVFTQGLWYEGGYSDADQNKRDDIVGFAAQSTHLSLGYDIEVSNTLLGLAYTNGSSNIHSDDSTQKLDSDDHLFTLYGRYDFDNWFVQSMFTVGHGNMDSVRYVEAQQLDADIDSELLSGLLQLGINTTLGDWQIVPMLSFEYSKQHFDDYQESEGSLALHVNSQDYEVFNFGGGAEVKRNWMMDWGSVSPSISAMIYYDVIGDQMQSVSRFTGGQTSFVANGADPAQTNWELSPSITLGTANDYPASFKLSYTYSGKEDFAASSISGELRFEF